MDERVITDDELKDAFDPMAEAKGQDFDTLVTAVHNLREYYEKTGQPDNYDLSDEYIARALQS